MHCFVVHLYCHLTHAMVIPVLKLLCLGVSSPGSWSWFGPVNRQTEKPASVSQIINKQLVDSCSDKWFLWRHSALQWVVIFYTLSFNIRRMTIIICFRRFMPI